MGFPREPRPQCAPLERTIEGECEWLLIPAQEQTVACPKERGKCCVGWVLFDQLAYGASNLGRGLKIRRCNGEQCESVGDFVSMCRSL